jgi:ketosteroid isomerase-like protein
MIRTMSDTPAPDDLQRMLDERACERIVSVYCHLVDFGDAPAIADLFTDDGEWTSAEVNMIGKDEIRAGFTRRQTVTRRQSRHLCTNVVITVEGEDATGVSYLVNYRHDSPSGTAELPAPADNPKYVGEYHDRFVRTGDGWKLTSRHFDITFLRPSAR